MDTLQPARKNNPLSLQVFFGMMKNPMKSFFIQILWDESVQTARDFPRFEGSEFGHFLPSNIALEFSMQYESVIAFGKIIIIEDAASSLVSPVLPTSIPAICLDNSSI